VSHLIKDIAQRYQFLTYLPMIIKGYKYKTRYCMHLHKMPLSYNNDKVK
jgi:hypothetical protein